MSGIEATIASASALPKMPRDRANAMTKARRLPYGRLLLGDPCAYCGAPAEVLDHIDAMRDGGSHGFENLTGCCSSCNNRKAQKSLLGWLGHLCHVGWWNGIEAQIKCERRAWHLLGRGDA